MLGEIYRLCGIVLITVALSTALRKFGSEISPYISQVSAILIFISGIAALTPIITYFKGLASGTASKGFEIQVILLSGSIAFIGSILSDICKENNCTLLKSAVEFSVNAEILALSLPILKEVITTVTNILNV